MPNKEEYRNQSPNGRVYFAKKWANTAWICSFYVRGSFR